MNEKERLLNLFIDSGYSFGEMFRQLNREMNYETFMHMTYDGKPIELIKVEKTKEDKNG